MRVDEFNSSAVLIHFLSEGPPKIARLLGKVYLTC